MNFRQYNSISRGLRQLGQFVECDTSNRLNKLMPSIFYKVIVAKRVTFAENNKVLIHYTEYSTDTPPDAIYDCSSNFLDNVCFYTEQMEIVPITKTFSCNIVASDYMQISHLTPEWLTYIHTGLSFIWIKNVHPSLRCTITLADFLDRCLTAKGLHFEPHQFSDGEQWVDVLLRYFNKRKNRALQRLHLIFHCYRKPEVVRQHLPILLDNGKNIVKRINLTFEGCDKVNSDLAEFFGVPGYPIQYTKSWALRFDEFSSQYKIEIPWHMPFF